MQLLALRICVVSARARGMPEITNHGKLFFRQKSLANGRLPGHVFRFSRNNAPPTVSIAREVIGSKSGRRTKHLAAVHVIPVSMARGKAFFVRGDNRSAPRGQTQNQSPIGCDTRDSTPHRTSATLRRISGRTPAVACAFGF